jgi:flagellar basal-body rod protein FlgG
MDATFETISSGVSALSRRYEAITHNMANANTAGFKRRVNSFSRVLDQMTRAGGPSQEIVGKVEAGTYIDHSQGALANTDRPLDVAIEGDGFFVVETPAGPRYTRNGAFQLSVDGQLVDARGRLIAGENGPITLPVDIPNGQVQISPEGNIRLGGQDVGRIRVVQFADNDRLIPAGDSCYLAPEDMRPRDAEGVRMYQGYKENSNVNIVEEMVNLISVTRLYEANIKAAKNHDEKQRNLLQVAAG